MELSTECSVAPCVSCGVPVVANFEIQQCKVCQEGYEPVLESMMYSKIACSEVHRNALN